MKRTFLIVSFLICMFCLSPSCSGLKEIVQEPSPAMLEEDGQPVTKALPGKAVCEEIMHCIQSDHIVMLINGIVSKDSVYVQTLTPKDMADLGITEEEMAFNDKYLDELNRTYDKSN